MSVREDLAAAASSVDGITGHPYFVQTTTPGHAFVRLERIDYPNAFGGVVRWNVVLILPQDLGQAERFLEDKVPAIREAVGEHLVVTSVQPQRLELAGVGVVPVAFVNGHREEGA